LEEDLRFLQAKLLQLRQDLGEERALFKQLEVEHEDLLEVLGGSEIRGQQGQVGLGSLESSFEGGEGEEEEPQQEDGYGQQHQQRGQYRHPSSYHDEEVEQFYYQRQPDLV